MAEVPVQEITDDDIRGVLIDLVQAQPVLWDMRLDTYHLTKTKGKDSKWKEIAEVLSINVKTAKNTWRNIRTQYNRELKKCVPRHSGSEGSEGENDSLYTGCWALFEKLSFLRDSVKAKETSGNLDRYSSKKAVENTDLLPSSHLQNENDGRKRLPEQTEYNEDYGNHSAVYDEDFIDDLAVEIDTEDHQIPSSTRDGSGSANCPNKRRTALQRSLDLEAKKIKIFEQRETNRVMENDEDMLFLKSLHPYLNQTEDKLGLRLEILRIIKDFRTSEELNRM